MRHGRVLESRVSDSLATITTDTGAFAPGDREFTHYQVPGLCLAAAHNTLSVLRRSIAAHAYVDSIKMIAPERETIPTGVAAVARACGVHFTVAGTAVHDLPDLFDLALFEGDSRLARAVINRRVALASTAAARDTVLQTAITWYLAATPARVSAAESTVAQVDAFGRESQSLSWRLVAHRQLLEFAEQTFEWSLMQREAEQILTLSHQMTDATAATAEPDVERAYGALALVDVAEHPDSLHALAQQARQTLHHARGKGLYRTYADAPVDTVLDWLVPAPLRAVTLGQHADSGPMFPPLTATYWFPARPDHWPPGAGPVSVIVDAAYATAQGIVRDDCLDDDKTILSAWAGQCYGDLVRSVRKWTEQYGSKLAITIVIPTRGRVLRSLLMPPASEADTLAWYFRDYLHLPVTVAVVEAAVRQQPPPNSYLTYTDTALGFKSYCDNPYVYQQGSESIGEVRLVTRTGHLLYAGDLSPLLDMVLDRVMANTTKSTASAPVSADDPMANSPHP